MYLVGHLGWGKGHDAVNFQPHRVVATAVQMRTINSHMYTFTLMAIADTKARLGLKTCLTTAYFLPRSPGAVATSLSSSFLVVWAVWISSK